MNNIAQKNKSKTPFRNKLKNNAIIRMLLGNSDLLSEEDILAAYSNNTEDLENSQIATELQASLASIDNKVTTKQKREMDELGKYKLSGIQKTSINKSRSTNTKTISSNSKSHDDERSI